MADYSEFPTTPTGWQERQLEDWQSVTPLETEDVDQPRRSVDLVALIPGVFFIVLSIVVMAGVDVPVTLFRDGGILWLVLIVTGAALLIGELRKARRKH